MEPEVIKKYVKIMEDNKLLELDIEWEGQKLRMRRIYEGARQQTPNVVNVSAAPTLAAVPTKSEKKKSAKNAPKEEIVFKAPMVGTFFRSASPDQPPLVDAGSKVEEKTVIGLVDAMKVMNEVKAGMAGTIVQVVAKDGSAVEYGQPLFIIMPA